jgi:hypothetical protein
VVVAVDLVQDGLDLVRVVLDVRVVVLRPVAAVRDPARRERVAVDLRREQVIDPVAGRTVEDLVRNVLVRPRRQQAVVVEHVEDRVHLQVLVRIDRLASLRVDRQRGGVDQRVLRLARQLHDPVVLTRMPR